MRIFLRHMAAIAALCTGLAPLTVVRAADDPTNDSGSLAAIIVTARSEEHTSELHHERRSRMPSSA